MALLSGVFWVADWDIILHYYHTDYLDGAHFFCWCSPYLYSSSFSSTLLLSMPFNHVTQNQWATRQFLREKILLSISMKKINGRRQFRKILLSLYFSKNLKQQHLYKM